MKHSHLKALTAAALVALSGMAVAAPEASTVASREQRMDEALQNYRNAPGNTGSAGRMAGSPTMGNGSSSGMNSGSAAPAKDGGGPVARAEAATKRGFHRAGDAMKRGAHKAGDAVHRNRTGSDATGTTGDNAVK